MSMPIHVKESSTYNPYLNQIIREYNSRPSSVKSSDYSGGSVGCSSGSVSCNSGGKGWSYSPYTQGNCNPSYINGH